MNHNSLKGTIMVTYAQKSSAQRAAKKLPEGSYSISQNEDGSFQIDQKGPSLQAFLKEHDESKISKAKKAKEIKAEYAPKIAATMPKSIVIEETAPIEAPDADDSKKSDGDDELSTLNLSHADNCPDCGISLENGICDYEHLVDVQGAELAATMQKRENACMACNFEWGPLVQHGTQRPTPQARADKKADAELVNVDPLKPRMSTIVLPTKKVWDIADKMPGAKRKDVIAACVQAGIAYGTARTQYQHWFKCTNDCKATPIATIGADGKIVAPK